MGVRLTSVEIDSWIEETDPAKLHNLATQVCENIKKLKKFKNAEEDIAQAFNLMVGAANFLESRAIYFMLRKIREQS